MTAIQQAARDRAVKFAQAAFPPSSMSGEESRDNHRRAVEQFIDDVITAATPGQSVEYNAARMWTCGCGAFNDISFTTCAVCNRPRSETSYAPDPRD